MFPGFFLGWLIAGAVLFFMSPWAGRSLYLQAFFAVVLSAFVLRAVGAALFKNAVSSERIMIIGHDSKWGSLIAEISNALGRKFLPHGYCSPDLDGVTQAMKEASSLSVFLIADRAFLEDQGVRKRSNFLRHDGRRVEYLPQIAEETLGRVPLSVAKEFNAYYDVALGRLKKHPDQRALDLAIALIGIIVGLPIMLLVALVVAIDSGFPVVFSQKRTGLFGREFTLYKFRSMMTVKQRGPAFADKDAYRITRVGKFIRKTRLDELPQLINVLKGDMSIVGPRPEQPAFVAQFSDQIPFYDFRHRLRPGITGWAQVNFTYAAGLAETAKKLEYDLYYVKNRSLLLDLQIILKTIETMLGMRGAR